MTRTEKERQQKVNLFEDVTIKLRDEYEVSLREVGDIFSESFEEWGLASTCIKLKDRVSTLSTIAKDAELSKEAALVKDVLKMIANVAVMTLVELELAENKSTEE